MLCIDKRQMSAEKVQVVRMGQVVDYEGSSCSISTAANGRKYINYGGCRFKFIRDLPALYGVAKHSKFTPKLSLIVRDPEMIATLSSLSERVKAEFKADATKVFKPFLIGDKKTGCMKLVLKINEESKCKDGAAIQGNVMPDDVCSVIFTTSVYEYGAYRGFSHKLEVVKVVPCQDATEHVL